MRTATTCALILAVGACSPPSPQPQPNEMETVDATRVDTAFPDGASGKDQANSTQGNQAQGQDQATFDIDRRSPADVVGLYASLLHQGRFADAYGLWEPASTSLSKDRFVKQFEKLDTIDASVGQIGPVEGAAGSLYDEVQLTLSGKTAAGENYSLTGPVTVKRVNDVPGATEAQHRWRIVKMQLTANPKFARALIKG